MLDIDKNGHKDPYNKTILCNLDFNIETILCQLFIKK